jgi:hypothetical protein
MAAPKTLSKFSITSKGDEFLLRIESEGGEALELTASYDQLDVLADQIDELLDADEDVLEVDEDEEADRAK